MTGSADLNAPDSGQAAKRNSLSVLEIRSEPSQTTLGRCCWSVARYWQRLRTLRFAWPFSGCSGESVTAEREQCLLADESPSRNSGSDLLFDLKDLRV